MLRQQNSDLQLLLNVMKLNTLYSSIPSHPGSNYDCTPISFLFTPLDASTPISVSQKWLQSATSSQKESITDSSLSQMEVEEEEAFDFNEGSVGPRSQAESLQLTDSS